jgi:tRNA(fMet)-specific endonuclease VapC
MRYMLDTNICVFVIRQQTPNVLAALRAHATDGIGISSIAVSELWFGVEKSASAKNAKALTQFLSPLEIAPYDESATQTYGRIRATLEAKGKTIGPLDTLIAAHALALDVTLVTNNTKEFRRVAGLRIVDWTKALAA